MATKWRVVVPGLSAWREAGRQSRARVRRINTAPARSRPTIAENPMEKWQTDRENRSSASPDDHGVYLIDLGIGLQSWRRGKLNRTAARCTKRARYVFSCAVFVLLLFSCFLSSAFGWPLPAPAWRCRVSHWYWTSVVWFWYVLIKSGWNFGYSLWIFFFFWLISMNWIKNRIYFWRFVKNMFTIYFFNSFVCNVLLLLCRKRNILFEFCTVHFHENTINIYTRTTLISIQFII